MTECLDGAGGWRRAGSLPFNPGRRRLRQRAGRCSWTDWENWALRRDRSSAWREGAPGEQHHLRHCPQALHRTVSLGWRKRRETCVHFVTAAPCHLPTQQHPLHGTALRIAWSLATSSRSLLLGAGERPQSTTAAGRFWGETHGVAVTSATANALTGGCPRDPPHVLMSPVLQATAGMALMWRGVLSVTPHLPQQTPNQRAPDRDFCKAHLPPGPWQRFTADYLFRFSTQNIFATGYLENCHHCTCTP